jgi:transcriptional regulator GlxA family with amidase domain
MPRPLRVHVVVLRDSTAIVPVAVSELLRKAEELAATMPAPARRSLAITLVGATRSVTTAGGFPVRCGATFDEVGKSDLVVVPALDPDIGARLASNAKAVAWVRKMFRAGADVASVCTGAFVLGEAGLLDGRSVTTHWAFQGLLAERYPKASIEPQAIVVDQGRVCTAGGATSFINLVLFLVERHLGKEAAFAASRMFLIDVNKSPQGAYAIFSPQKNHGDAEILRAQEIIERDQGRASTVDTLAQRIAMTKRTFTRRFKSATGNTPSAYIQRVRVEAAKRALEQSRAPLHAVAGDVGYLDVVAFRKTFARWTGLTPAAYRQRYTVVGSNP